MRAYIFTPPFSLPFFSPFILPMCYCNSKLIDLHCLLLKRPVADSAVSFSEREPLLHKKPEEEGCNCCLIM